MGVKPGWVVIIIEHKKLADGFILLLLRHVFIANRLPAMQTQRNPTDDKYLFEQIKRGDTKAFEMTFRRFAPRLEAFACRYTNDSIEAEDIVQEAFLKLWERRELLENISLSAFLFMLVRNDCLNRAKHQQIIESVEVRLTEMEQVEQLYAIDFAEDPSTRLVYKELATAIDHIMEALPDKCREAFTLSRLKGLKNREIASQMAITEKVVEKHITRALKRFKEGLAGYLPALLMGLWRAIG